MGLRPFAGVVLVVVQAAMANGLAVESKYLLLAAGRFRFLARRHDSRIVEAHVLILAGMCQFVQDDGRVSYGWAGRISRMGLAKAPPMSRNVSALPLQ
jgi:hypothetical protein